MKKGMAPIIAEMLIILFAFSIVAIMNSPVRNAIFPTLKKINKNYDYVETMSFSSIDASYEGPNIKLVNSGYTNLTNITIFLDYTEIGKLNETLSPGNFTLFYIGNLTVNGSKFIIFTNQGAKAILNYNESIINNRNI